MPFPFRSFSSTHLSRKYRTFSRPFRSCNGFVTFPFSFFDYTHLSRQCRTSLRPFRPCNGFLTSPFSLFFFRFTEYARRGICIYNIYRLRAQGDRCRCICPSRPLVAPLCDPSGLRSNACIRTEERLGFRVKLLPKRTPECMPLDMSLWKEIEADMRTEEDSWQGGPEPFPDGPIKGRGQRRMTAWQDRLERTARAQGEELVRRTCGVVADRCREIIAAGGKHIKEGRKTKRKQRENDGKQGADKTPPANLARNERTKPTADVKKGATSVKRKERKEAAGKTNGAAAPFFQRQRGDDRCGMYAMNNIFGHVALSDIDVQNAAAVVAAEMNERKSRHARKNGDFSIEALATAARLFTDYRVDAHNPCDDAAAAFDAAHGQVDVAGILIHKPWHWVAARRIAGQLWYFDSLYKQPRRVTAPQLDAILNRHGPAFKVYAGDP